MKAGAEAEAVPVKIEINSFFPMLPFDPPESIRKSLILWCFQGDQKGTLGKNGLFSRSYV